MPAPLVIALPLVLAVVFVGSGLGKLRHPESLVGWQRLGVPAPFRHRWLLAVHPWAELALGVVLAVLGGVPGMVVAVIATLLIAGYLVLVIRAVRSGADATCGCFGAPAPVATATVLRNAWLLLLAAAAATVIGSAPVIGGALAQAAAGRGAWWWLVALVVAATTTWIILRAERPVASGSRVTGAVVIPGTVRRTRTGGAEPAGAVSGTAAVDAAPTEPDEQLEDYIRTRTPAVPVTFGDGAAANLRSLAATEPVLLLAVSATCEYCVPVLEQVPRWRELLPEVSIRLLLTEPPEQTPLTETAEPRSLHDPEGLVSASIQDWATPTAVLLGADGMLAGGPVTGPDEVQGLVAEIDNALHPDRATIDAEPA